MVQALPSHEAVRVRSMPALPTATQLVAKVQETPEKLPPSLGVGVGTEDQLLPFHDSASVETVPPVLKESPTAVHCAAVVQEIPKRSLLFGSGLGLGRSVQLLPFHDSARV
jgi:hypothetical protein